MPSKTRLANKTIWSLEDIIAAGRRARRAWREANKRATEQMDTVMLIALNKLSDEIARIETLARDARRGEYHPSTEG